MNPEHADEWRCEYDRSAAGPDSLANAGAGALGVLRPYNPVSWFHARGIYRVLARLKPRLPDVGGKLFLTFTINPLLFADPLAAFEHGRDRLRRVFFKLRHGVEWEGKHYTIDAPYCIKLEFHQNGWAHFHAVFLTRNYVPGGLLNQLWALGRTNVRRISNHEFHYLLKYVTKGGGLPAWVLGRNRVRIFQSSHGFLEPVNAPERPEASVPTGRKNNTSTLGERLDRWRRTALFQSGDQFQQVFLNAPFYELLSEFVFLIAVGGRYLGAGNIQINDPQELHPWLN